MIVETKRKASQQELADRVDELQKRLENSISKDEIRNKIEQLNIKEKKELKGLKGTDRYFTKLEYMYKKNVLQDLLKKE